jgi:hypothetical protein
LIIIKPFYTNKNKKHHYNLGVPPQEKCGVGLFVPAFFILFSGCSNRPSPEK